MADCDRMNSTPLDTCWDTLDLDRFGLECSDVAVAGVAGVGDVVGVADIVDDACGVCVSGALSVTGDRGRGPVT